LKEDFQVPKSDTSRATRLERLERFERLELFVGLLLKFRHHALCEQPDIFHCHFLRHATEIKRSGDRGQTDSLAPFLDRVNAPLGVAGNHKPLAQLGFGIALDYQSLFFAIGICGSRYK
jgi:hypothetical protein